MGSRLRVSEANEHRRSRRERRRREAAWTRSSTQAKSEGERELAVERVRHGAVRSGRPQATPKAADRLIGHRQATPKAADLSRALSQLCQDIAYTWNRTRTRDRPRSRTATAEGGPIRLGIGRQPPKAGRSASDSGSDSGWAWGAAGGALAERVPQKSSRPTGVSRADGGGQLSGMRLMVAARLW